MGRPYSRDLRELVITADLKGGMSRRKAALARKLLIALGVMPRTAFRRERR